MARHQNGLMGLLADDPRRHGLRAGFDAAAEDYQRTRPVCPPELFDDLIDCRIGVFVRAVKQPHGPRVYPCRASANDLGSCSGEPCLPFLIKNGEYKLVCPLTFNKLAVDEMCFLAHADPFHQAG